MLTRFQFPRVRTHGPDTHFQKEELGLVTDVAKQFHGWNNSSFSMLIREHALWRKFMVSSILPMAENVMLITRVTNQF
jgi:hemerythrin-like domain-containing protein